MRNAKKDELSNRPRNQTTFVMTREIKQTVTINAAPAEVFAALMDETKHSQFTGEPAKINPQPGGAFTCYGDYINGITLELQSPSLIVQAPAFVKLAQGNLVHRQLQASPAPEAKTKLVHPHRSPGK